MDVQACRQPKMSRGRHESGQKSPKWCRSLQFQEFRHVRTNPQPENLRGYMLYELCRELENERETDSERGVNWQALRAHQ